MQPQLAVPRMKHVLTAGDGFADMAGGSVSDALGRTALATMTGVADVNMGDHFTLSGWVVPGDSNSLANISPRPEVSFQPISPKFLTQVAEQLQMPHGASFGAHVIVRDTSESFSALFDDNTGDVRVIGFPTDIRAIYLGTAETGLSTDGHLGFFESQALALLPEIEGQYALAITPHEKGFQLRVHPNLWDLADLALNVIRVDQDSGFSLDAVAVNADASNHHIDTPVRKYPPGDYLIQLRIGEGLMEQFEVMVQERPVVPKRRAASSPLPPLSTPSVRKDPSEVPWRRLPEGTNHQPFVASLSVASTRGIQRREIATQPGLPFSWQPFGNAFTLYPLGTAYGGLHMIADKAKHGALEVYNDRGLLIPPQHNFWRLVPGAYGVRGTGGPDITFAFQQFFADQHQPGSGVLLHNRLMLSDYIQRLLRIAPVNMTQSLGSLLSKMNRIYAVAARAPKHFLAVIERNTGRIIEFGGTVHEWDNAIAVQLIYNFATQRISVAAAPDASDLDPMTLSELSNLDGLDMAIPPSWEHAPDTSYRAALKLRMRRARQQYEQIRYGLNAGPLQHPELPSAAYPS